MDGVTERQWVESVKACLAADLHVPGMTVETGHRLAYALHVSAYEGELAKPVPKVETRPYQTDLVIIERQGDSAPWLPRVVVEFKLGSVTTHDALTYSAKAATHKNVHPYLRYGIVIGQHAGPVPRRLLWHGHQFDFMLTVPTLDPVGREQLCELLRQEIQASKTIERLLETADSGAKLVHRYLRVA